MGVVYRGVHTVFDEVVAVKAIFPELTLNPELRERFLNEAKIQRRLQHPNIVQIREFLIDQGKFYIVMEFIEGETLAQHLRQLGRPMVASEAIEIFRQALEGLGFAHAQGVIHRDIKPSNIMLTREGVAKLTDFGIARALGTAKLTRTGTALGTPAYMSPEQIQGAKLDHRTDIYSMGITLYEILTGRVPFERPKDSDSDFPILAAHINQAPLPPSQLVSEIPLFLETAILKALEKRPEDRFQSCQEFQAALVPSPLPTTKKAAVAPLAEPKRPEPAEPSARPFERRVAPEPAGETAKEPAPPPRPPVPKPEPYREPKQVLPQPPLPQFRTEGKSPWVLAGSLVALVMIVAVLAWVNWPSPPNQPTGGVSTPSVNNPQANPNPPSPQPQETVRPVVRGQARENPKDGLKYVWIPRGTFMMGCSPGDNECWDLEKPSHQVTITKGFWIGQTEVTVGAYKRFAGATGRQMPDAPDFNSGWANDTMPIVDVTWNEAHDYCTWAGGRLPTEAEWEYAARGGSTEARYGNLDEVAWYQGNSAGQPHEVAQKRANGFGLYDMLGNVWEWVNDWYNQNYYQNSPSQDPTGPTSGTLRVLRGGSWGPTPRVVRVSYRVGYYPDVRSNDVGVRCVWEVVSP